MSIIGRCIYCVSYILVRLAYRYFDGANPVHIVGTVFFFQKVIGINRSISWPVHSSSRVLYPERILLGTRSFPGWSSGCYIQARNGIKIGNNLRMGPNVGLISSNHSLNDYDEWEVSQPIQIGNNVWLGMGSIVMPGVNIGDNVVIGANAVVTKDIPPNSIAAGVPCRVVKVKPPYEGKQYESK